MRTYKKTALHVYDNLHTTYKLIGLHVYGNLHTTHILPMAQTPACVCELHTTDKLSNVISPCMYNVNLHTTDKLPNVQPPCMYR